MKFLRFILLVIVFSVLTILVNPAIATPPKNILMVGNSYTFYNNMPKMLEAMLNADANGTHYKVDQITVGGVKLKSFVKNPELLQKLDSKTYNYVVFQEQSKTPLYSDERIESEAAIKLLSQRAKQNGSQVFLFSTWARKSGSDVYTGPKYNNFTPPAGPDDMTMQIHKYYESMARKNGVMMIPVGRFWQSVIKKQPMLELYDADKSHPNVNGSYLTAMLFYSSIAGRSPHVDLWAPPEISEQARRQLIFAITGK